eukprot:548637-Rhodomonas_salina.2
MDAARRPGACRWEMEAAGDEALAMNLTLCYLDGDTAELCRTIAEAEADIVEAAGGWRLPLLHLLLLPGDEFYLEVEELACDEAAAERAALDEQIRAAVPALWLLATGSSQFETCTALSLNAVMDLLGQMRTVLHTGRAAN